MKAQHLAVAAAALVTFGAVIGGFLWWKSEKETQDEAQAALDSAREALESAKTAESKAKIPGLLSSAAEQARAARRLRPALSLDATLIEGEALIRATKFTAAVELLEDLVAAHPDDARAADLAAQAHHQSYLLAKRSQDFAAALQLYEKADSLGAPAGSLFAAAQLCEAAGQFELADKYIDTLQSKHSGSGEADAGKQMKAARAAPTQK
jgi:tetratricopeptide (TPR) repeat protein